VTRAKTAAAILLIGIGLLLPVQGVATALVGTAHPALPDVELGIWLFKALLILHGALLAVLIRVNLPGSGDRQAAREVAADSAWATPESLVLIALLVIAVATRLYDLGNGLWFDEIAALVKYVRLPLGQLVATYDSQNQHVLYALLARVSTGVAGESAWALRLPAVLFGIASLPALYWFGTQVTSRREALLATALLTVSYHHVWFSQNARGYTGLLMWTLLGTGLFLKLLDGREVRGWGYALAYGLVMALATYTHATAALVVVAHALVWLAVVARRAGPRVVPGDWAVAVALLLSATISLQLYAPLLPQFLETLTRPTMGGVEVDWKNPAWMVAELARGLGRAVPGGWVSIAGASALGLAGLVSYGRRNTAWAALMVLPGVLTAAALLATEHNLWPRFFFFSAGFAILILIRGVFVAWSVMMPQRQAVLATATAVALVVVSAATLPRAYGPKQDFVGARDYVRSAGAPGDAIVTLDLAEFPYRSYLAENWTTIETPEELERIEREHWRTWVLYTFPTRLAAMRPEIWARLQEKYTTAAEFPGTVGGGTVVIKVHESHKS